MSLYQFKGKIDGNYEGFNPQTVIFRGKDGKSVFAIGCNTSFQRTMFFHDDDGCTETNETFSPYKEFPFGEYLYRAEELDVQMFFPASVTSR